MDEEGSYVGLVQGMQASEVGEEWTDLCGAVVVWPRRELYVLECAGLVGDRMSPMLNHTAHKYAGGAGRKLQNLFVAKKGNWVYVLIHIHTGTACLNSH